MEAKQQFYEKINEILPTVGEGLEITKDYAFDLFGRYISYLIVIDSAFIIIGIILIILCLYLIFKAIKTKDYDTIVATSMFGGFIIVFLLLLVVTSGVKLIKDIYIPEIRILEIYNRK